MYPSPQNFVFANDVLLLLTLFNVLILYSVERCLNHRLDLSDFSPSSMFILVCDVPRIASVMASAAWLVLHYTERFLFYC